MEGWLGGSWIIDGLLFWIWLAGWQEAAGLARGCGRRWPHAALPIRLLCQRLLFAESRRPLPAAPYRPDGKQWLKFDDERVEKADDQKAIEDNWGGEGEAPPGGEPLRTPGLLCLRAGLRLRGPLDPCKLYGGSPTQACCLP